MTGNSSSVDGDRRTFAGFSETFNFFVTNTSASFSREDLEQLNPSQQRTVLLVMCITLFLLLVTMALALACWIYRGKICKSRHVPAYLEPQFPLYGGRNSMLESTSHPNENIIFNASSVPLRPQHQKSRL